MTTKERRQLRQSTSEIAQTLKARADAKRTRFERFADHITIACGSMTFLLANLVWFVIWIVINLNWIPGVPAFDPFPFGLLTMIVSLEAIVLAIIVLISQNREAKIADLREEVDLQIDVMTEQEITKILQLLTLLLDKLQVEYPKDKALEGMLQTTDTEKLEKSLEEEVR